MRGLCRNCLVTCSELGQADDLIGDMESSILQFDPTGDAQSRNLIQVCPGCGMYYRGDTTMCRECWDDPPENWPAQRSWLEAAVKMKQMPLDKEVILSEVESLLAGDLPRARKLWYGV